MFHDCVRDMSASRNLQTFSQTQRRNPQVSVNDGLPISFISSQARTARFKTKRNWLAHPIHIENNIMLLRQHSLDMLQQVLFFRKTLLEQHQLGKPT